MNAVLGDLLPLAVGVAISPIPIIAVILMLLAPRATGTSLGFLVGWVLGVVVAITAFVLLAEGTDLAGSDGSSSGPSWVKVGLGVLLLLIASKQWRSRPRSATDAKLPGWMAAIDTFTPLKAAGLGFVLAAVNPKNLTLCAAGGVAIGAGGLSAGEAVGGIAFFTVIAVSTVAIPTVGYLVARDRMREPLDDLHAWLTVNNATVMSVLLLVIGVVLVGKGFGGL
jgi:hypothetical protein